MQKLSSTFSLEKSTPKIGIDLLGSETHPEHLLSSIIDSFEKMNGQIELFLFLRQQDITLHIPDSIHTVIASDAVLMDDTTFSALKKKKTSSLGIGIQMLKNKEIDAFISAGNTGAILAHATTTLNTIHGIERPALLALLPAKEKTIAVLDVGANARSSASQLLEFAQMGIAYQKLRGIKQPKVALLNIGAEEKKGTPEHQKAYAYLLKLNEGHSEKIFLGNIEARDVFESPADVIVTDGFTGNIFLKTVEGIAKFLLDEISSMTPNDQFLNESIKFIIDKCNKKLDYSEYPGAILCGVEGIVLKYHSSSSSKALKHTLDTAIELTKQNFLSRIQQELSL
jgi:glycerol-3-phosphate acyltransferase PlsX